MELISLATALKAASLPLIRPQFIRPMNPDCILDRRIDLRTEEALGRRRHITLGGTQISSLPLSFLILFWFLFPFCFYSDGNGGTILDSGSTFTFMEWRVFESLAQEFEKQMGNISRAGRVFGVLAPVMLCKLIFYVTIWLIIKCSITVSLHGLVTVK